MQLLNEVILGRHTGSENADAKYAIIYMSKLIQGALLIYTAVHCKIPSTDTANKNET